jgi:hypothetical protein
MNRLFSMLSIAAFVAAVASPASAQNPKAAQLSNAVIVGGTIVGQDPDIGIRSQLLREYATHAGGGAE